MRAQIADRIRNARRQAGLTQGQVALAVGVHRGTFGHWERGDDGHLPGHLNLLRLAQCLGVNFEWLTSGRGAMQDGPRHEDVPAVRLDCFAHTEEEERLLEGFRKLPMRTKRAVMKLIDGA